MPTLTPPAQVAQIQMQGLVSARGSTSRNADWLFYFVCATPVGAILKTQVEAAFQAAVAVPLVGALNLRYAQTFNAVRLLANALDPFVQVPRAVVGGITGDSMTTVNSLYVLLRTGIRGKNYRGSKHFFPLSESDTTVGSDDILNAAAITRWNAVLTAWNGGFTDAGGNVWLPCVFSKSLSQVRTNPTVVVYNVVTQFLLNERIGIMKKRRVASLY
jgi:hypothetical protein